MAHASRKAFGAGPQSAGRREQPVRRPAGAPIRDEP